jgi:SAM-dependent methyltransferase
MREQCPVCRCERREDSWQMDFVVPDGWTLPSANRVCRCLDCGFVYYDNDRRQEHYDLYYQQRYGFGVDTPENYARLDALAEEIEAAFPLTDRVLDFGGGGGYLVAKLEERGYSARTWSPGEPPPEAQSCDLLIASHVLEHVYGLGTCISSLREVLTPDGFVLAEVPDEMAASFQTRPPLLDYIQQHVNHFGPFHLDLLFNRYGFSRESGKQTSFNGAFCYRALYRNDGHRGMWKRSREHIEQAMAEKAAKLRKIQKPVIVWGCSNTVWHLLTIAEFPIAYFVDRDIRAYPAGSTIRGIPVYDRVCSDDPILVLAQGQRQAILENIRERGLKNEVLEA